MSFTIENVKQSRMSLIDEQTICEDETFATYVYHKSTLSRFYTHFDSFLQSTYKFSNVYTLVYKCFQICSGWTKLHTKLVCLKKVS